MDVNGTLGSALRRALERLKVLDRPDRGGEVAVENFVFFATPETGHDQDSGCDSATPQLDGLLGRGYAEPGCAGLLESARALDGSVPIGIALDYAASRRFR